MRTRANRFSHKQMIARASRKQISRRPRASRSSSPDLFHDGLHILMIRVNCSLVRPLRTNGTIGVDLLAPTALRCHLSVMLLCLFAFRRFLLLTKANTLSELSGPTSPTPKKNDIGFLKFRYVGNISSAVSPRHIPTRALQHRQGQSHHYE